jgi:membrane-bound metal-dependent hydrolase YbcI (DUF457 family)
MPSPLGHALAGFTLGLVSQPPAANPGRSRRLVTRFTVLAALVAALPDADLLFGHVHRGWTHSFGASLLILIVTIIVTGKVTRLGVVLALAQASHIALDWVSTDRFPPRGIQALWPLTRGFYLSGWEFFPPTERNFANPEIVAINIRAAVFELIVMGTIAMVAVFLTRRRRNRVPISVPGGPPPPSV